MLVAGQLQRALAVAGEQQTVVVLQDVLEYVQVGWFVIHQQYRRAAVLEGHGVNLGWMQC